MVPLTRGQDEFLSYITQRAGEFRKYVGETVYRLGDTLVTVHGNGSITVSKLLTNADIKEI